MCEKQYKRYIVMGLRDGEIHHIIARRGHTPDALVEQVLNTIRGPSFLTETDRHKSKFDRLYILEVGDEGTYGGSTNLKLQEIKEPAPVPKWTLVLVKGLYG